MYAGEWKGSQHHGQGRKTDCYGQVEYDGLWVNHKPEGDLRKPPPSTGLPQEVIVNANYTSQDECSDLDASIAEPPRLRRTVTPPSPRAPSHARMSRSMAAWGHDSYGESTTGRTQYSRPQEAYHGPSRAQEIFRFGSQSVSIKPPPPRPQSFWADPPLCPAQQRQVSRGEMPLRTPYEGLPDLSTLIRDQQRALEKYNAFHRSRELTNEDQLDSNVARGEYLS